MLPDQLREGLTFDDVLLVPSYSEVIPRDVDTTTRLTPAITLRIPLVSSAMDTVTEAATAIRMAREGGIGFVHKNMPIEAQAIEVVRVKKAESGIVVDPVTITPEQRLEVALAGRNRVEVFPQLAQGWLKASELRSRMLQVRAQVLDAVAAELSEQPREYKALRKARQEAAERFERVPTSAVAVMSREARVDDELRRLDTELFKLDVAIRGLEAQLVAIDRYIEDQTRVEGGRPGDKRVLAQVEIELAQARELRTELRALADALSLERIQIGIGDEASARDDRVRLDYLAALEAELDWLRARGVSLPMDLFSAARDVDTRVGRFHRRARSHVDRKAGDYTAQLAREAANIAEYQRDLGDYQAQTETLGGAIAARSFLHVLGRIDGLVLEADVGLVDVAWKQKQDKSDQISRLLSRQADDLKALDQTWREVRGE